MSFIILNLLGLCKTSRLVFLIIGSLMAIKDMFKRIQQEIILRPIILI